MQTSHKTYFKNLDATRFVAFIPVFFTHVFFTHNPTILQSNAYHFIENHFKVGILGLDYFFVLSSFLITWIILEEYKNTTQFNIKFFIVRRSLRIWPLYFFIVGLGFAISYFLLKLNGSNEVSVPAFYNFLFFIVNFYIINHGDNFLFFMVFLWSVSVEEQFYLFWAFMLKFLKNYFLPVCFALIFISLLYRWSVIDEQKKIYFHTLSTLANFAIGALVAYISFYKNAFYNVLIKITKSQIAIVYFLFLMNLIFYRSIYSYAAMQVCERLIFSLFFGFIIFEQSFSEHSLFKLGNWKVPNYLGNASFGLYCYHGVVITVFIKLSEHFLWSETPFTVFILNPILIFVATIAVTSLSYELAEKRILKLKSRFYTH